MPRIRLNRFGLEFDLGKFERVRWWGFYSFRRPIGPNR